MNPSGAVTPPGGRAPGPSGPAHRPRARRRVLAVVGALVAVVAAPLTVPVPAGAQDPWAGSAWTEGYNDGIQFTVLPIPVSGRFRYSGPAGIDRVELTLQRTSGDPPNPPSTTTTTPTSTSSTTTSSATTSTSTTTTSTTTTTPGGPCDHPPPPPVRAERPGQTELAFSFEINPVCNGRWRLVATAHAAAPDDATGTLTLTIRVDVPPPPPRDLTVTVDGGRTPVLEWQEPDAAPPDLRGWQIERNNGDGFVSVDVVSRGVHKWADANPRPDAGTVAYRVRARRGTSDGSEMVSDPSNVVAVEVSDPPPPTTAADGDPSADDGDSPPPTGDGSTATTVDPAERLRQLNELARANRPRITPPTTADTGFEDTLPFDTDRRVTRRVTEVADDQSVVRLGSDEDDGAGGVGVLASVAGALVLFVAAVQLRFLTRHADRIGD